MDVHPTQRERFEVDARGLRTARIVTLISVQTNANLKAQELSTFYVDRWLDKRGLVVSPKGADFKATPLSQKQET